MIARLSLALMTIVMVAGCESNRYLIDDSTGPSGQQAFGAAPTINTAEPGAKAQSIAELGPVAGPTTFNSDNRPVITRTGINSDPNNPSGAPGTVRAWNSI